MKILSLDLSFSSTGVAIFDNTEKTIMLDAIKKKEGEYHKTFKDIQTRLSMFLPSLDKLFEGVDFWLFEEPFPFGSFASGLWGLDSAVCQRFYHIPHSSYNARTLAYIHQQSKQNKKYSKDLANSLVDLFRGIGYGVVIKSKTHDAAEAFIYLIHDAIMQGRLEEDIRKKIQAINPQLGTLAGSLKKAKIKKVKETKVKGVKEIKEIKVKVVKETRVKRAGIKKSNV